jgi:hypothetical protein
MKRSSNELYLKVMRNIMNVEDDIKKGCSLAKNVQYDYEYWQKNVLNKEAAFKLQTSFNKWNNRHEERNQ